MLKDDKARKEHQASCLRAMIRVFALTEHHKAATAMRVEPLGTDRSRRYGNCIRMYVFYVCVCVWFSVQNKFTLRVYVYIYIYIYIYTYIYIDI
jgi:hypothetical protein